MKLSAHLNLQLVALEQPDTVDVLVELTAPPASTTVARPPATLQVVLDRSGSMSRGRLSAAVTALLALVDRLDPTNNLGVVAFDDQVSVVVPAGPLLDKDAARAALRAVRPGGSTDLSAGYLRGLQEARRVAGPAGATLLLISDGHANRGVTEPGRMSRLAAQARTHGVSTSTLGLGLGYDETLLDALAHGGAGTTHFAEEADTAAAMIASEADGLLEQVAHAVSLRVVPDAPVQAVAVLNDLPTSATADAVTVELGSFTAGETRKLVLRMEVPGCARLGLTRVATMELTHVALPELVQHHTATEVHVNVVPAELAAGRLPDPVVTHEALVQTAQRVKKQVAGLIADGDLTQALTLLNAASCEAATGGAREESDALRDLAVELADGHHARAAKRARTDAAFDSRFRGKKKG